MVGAIIRNLCPERVSVEALMSPSPVRTSCWICGRACPLENCKIDEHGLAVHEECYVARVVLKSATNPSQKNRVLETGDE